MAIINVPSDSHPTMTSYQVDTETGTCTCPRYQHQMKARNEQNPPDERVHCKHFDRAIQMQAEGAA
jgi:hypothetical protein